MLRDVTSTPLQMALAGKEGENQQQLKNKAEKNKLDPTKREDFKKDPKSHNIINKMYRIQ